ncbi:hypothetical protein AtNW77_Chr3g0194611 [Arabidopsis thaliana]
MGSPPSLVIISPFSRPGAMETKGNVFRCFKNRKDTILPTFDRWRPAIRERFLLLAHYSSRARREVKGRGMELIQGDILFIQTEKTRTELESDIKEYESNLLLLDQTHDEDFSLYSHFSDSKCLPTEPEMVAMPVKTPEPTPILPEVPLVVNSETVIIANDEDISGFELETSTKQPPIGETTGLESAAAETVDPEPTVAEFETPGDSTKELPPFVLSTPTARCSCPTTALSQPAFSSLTLLSISHRRTKKRHKTSWTRNFDCVAKIPTMLRMYLRAQGQVPGPVNTPVKVIPCESEDDDEEEPNNS